MSRVLVIPDVHLKPWIFDMADRIDDIFYQVVGHTPVEEPLDMCTDFINHRCCLYNEGSKKATDVLLRPIPLFCKLIAEVMINGFFRKIADTQKE